MINFATGELKLPEITLNPSVTLNDTVAALKDRIDVKEVVAPEENYLLFIDVVFKSSVTVDENLVLAGMEFSPDGAFIRYVLYPTNLSEFDHFENAEFDAWVQYFREKGIDAGMVPQEEYQTESVIPGFLQGDACSINMSWFPLIDVYVRHSTKT